MLDSDYDPPLMPQPDPASRLGVIAMGRDHADRVEKAVFASLEGAPDRGQLAARFSDQEDEPYFFKNIGRVKATSAMRSPLRLAAAPAATVGSATSGVHCSASMA